MKKNIFIILGIIGIIALLGVIFSIDTSTEVVYPLYASVCCEATGPEDWKSNTFYYDDVPDIGIVCPKTTTQCRVKDVPDFDCGILHWSYLIKLTEPTGASRTFEGSSLTGESELETAPSDQKQVSALGNMYWDLNCVLGKDKATIYWDKINTKLYVYPAMEGKYDISGTDACKRNYLVNRYEWNMPKQLSAEVKNLINNLIGGDISKPKPTKGDIKEIPEGNSMAAGECYLGVDKWVKLPAFGNVNPFGQYQGKDVICSLSKGLVQVDQIQIEDNSWVFVPTKRLSQPDKFCCDHQYCRETYGIDFNCVDYSCKEAEGSCRSDLDCQPQGGVKLDANCYREPDTMNFYKWDSECVSAKCTSASKESVKCCPSYCTTQGMYCDFTKGCIQPDPDPQPCPAGMCCLEGNAANYIPKECEGKLDCCADKKGFGKCAAECGNGVCGAWITAPKLLGGEVIVPDLWCKLNLWIKDTIKTIAILFGIIAGIFGFVYGNKIIQEQKMDDTVRWILNIIIALTIGFLIYFITAKLWWLGLILLILIIVLKNVVKGFKLW